MSPKIEPPAKPRGGLKLQPSKSSGSTVWHISAMVLASAVGYRSAWLGAAMFGMVLLDKLAQLMTQNLLFPSFLVRWP